MPFEGRWHDMPEDLGDLSERILEGYEKGFEAGKGLGEGELAEKILEFLKNQYYRPETLRKTPEAEAILTLVRELSPKIKIGGEFRNYKVKPRKVPPMPDGMAENKERYRRFYERRGIKSAREWDEGDNE